ncbi:MAG: hypothetical protein KDD44_14455, partial [Bdellovibrionales bacterium]|nr:hypothetical protein [Bdellovibrionales bacterium]
MGTNLSHVDPEPDGNLRDAEVGLEQLAPLSSRHSTLLIASVFIIAMCGIVYELLVSTLSSYLLGSSVLHFSLTIGLFMFFMGVGSYLSKFITSDVLSRFIQIEIVIGLVGGLSALILQASFSLTEYYYLTMVGVIAIISAGVGLEIPLVTRMVRTSTTLKDALAHILAFDYLGALVASLAFPLLLLPYLGVVKTALIIGLLNLAVAAVNIRTFFPQLPRAGLLALGTGLASLVLLAGLSYAFTLSSFLEKFVYQDPIIYTAQTPYQRIVVTKFE